MLSILVATVTSTVVGFMQVSPGICQVDYVQDHNEIVTVIQECSSQSWYLLSEQFFTLSLNYYA